MRQPESRATPRPTTALGRGDVPTGSRAGPLLVALAARPPATCICARTHHAAPQQRPLTPTAWIRPGGTVWLRVSSRPRWIRNPSARGREGEPPVGEQRPDRGLDRADHGGDRAGDRDEAQVAVVREEEDRRRDRQRQGPPLRPEQLRDHAGRGCYDLDAPLRRRERAARRRHRRTCAVPRAAPDGAPPTGRAPTAPRTMVSRRSRSAVASGPAGTPAAPRSCRPDHLEPQLGQPEAPGQQRPDQLDRLQPLERDGPGTPPQQPLVDPQLPPDDVVAGDQPAHHRADQHQPPPRSHGEQPPLRCPGSGSPARRWRRWPARRGRPPRSSGVSGCSAARRGSGGEPGGGRCQAPWDGHRPSARASPRAARRSRSRAASSGGRPGILASVAAAAVCSCTVASPNSRSTGPAVTSTNCIRP